MADGVAEADQDPSIDESAVASPAATPAGAQRGKTVHGEAANAGHRVLAPDDAEVEAYLETALNAAVPEAKPGLENQDQVYVQDPDGVRVQFADVRYKR